ncbi:lipocalin-15-like [Egretta garzetta]|uniref:lipocalin-15-like n=1 Tax=Egretta garzetta TaxID=188379 RepID=UPI00163C0847|nr:lipocalin-15-like [Egretta garzetta]
MTAMLPSLVLALLCLLWAEAEVPVQPGFNAEKFAGMWHVSAAASNCTVFLKMKDGMKSSIATISFTPEGDLAMKLVWPLMDRCQRFELLFQQSGQAGHYMAAEEKRELRVGETDSTREQDISFQLLQKLRELIPAVGLTEDMLAVLPKSDQCTKAIR